ncbi:hypothetical protein LINGRAHAP2_LOCUS33316 [Linum grandiflorum]
MPTPFPFVSPGDPIFMDDDGIVLPNRRNSRRRKYHYFLSTNIVIGSGYMGLSGRGPIYYREARDILEATVFAAQSLTPPSSTWIVSILSM